MLTIAWLESDFNSVMETYRWLVPKVHTLYKHTGIIESKCFSFKL